ncbi:tail fiber assembly protein [Pseudomonas sp. TH15]|uniref:tail fiber assembly protein n=1 Tax=Pseudomonas sp. TH15 TaxID=2796381 RepID=UPI001914B706|nr:tail fiber assembly protein [Pseudomonas sp. TH15]MBK5510645.1 tail fiber assembly protein [Pseudomonas sp. TH15]
MAYYYLVDEMTQQISGPVSLPVVPGMEGSIPGNVIELPELLPPAEASYVWAWRNGVTVQLLDMRNQLAYRKDNGMPQYWTELGPLPDNLTFKPRPSLYHAWRDDDWALDLDLQREGEAAQAEIDRDNRLRTVVIRVAPLQYAYDLGEATSEQLTALQAWKRYALKLTQIELQPDYPLSIIWPTAPAKSVVLPNV